MTCGTLRIIGFSMNVVALLWPPSDFASAGVLLKLAGMVFQFCLGTTFFAMFLGLVGTWRCHAKSIRKLVNSSNSELLQDVIRP